MRFGTGSGRGAALAVAAVLLAGTAVRVHAAEGNFLEMLFGIRPAPQPAPQMQPPPERRAARPRGVMRVGAARNRLRARYAALPVKIHIGEARGAGVKAGDEKAGDRQVSIDMRQGAAAAFLKDETLEPGDIVVFNTGARVFIGGSVKHRTLSDFEPASASSYVDKRTRALLAGMVVPVGALPADAARRMAARRRREAPDATAAQAGAPVGVPLGAPLASPLAVAQTGAPPPVQPAVMRVINPWRAAP